MAVDGQVALANGRTVDVLFVATDKGRLLKLVNVARRCVAEAYEKYWPRMTGLCYRHKLVSTNCNEILT